MVVDGNPVTLGNFSANGTGDPRQWFATKNPNGTPIFINPAAGTFNNQRVRDIIYGPGFQNYNAGLFKGFAINERIGFQFRAEAFNVINHPNLGGGSGGFGSNNVLNPTQASVGKITSKGGSPGNGERNMQLSLRFYF
jgi:hypothetical protein